MFFISRLRVIVLALLSSILIMPAQAHEVLPTIGDVEEQNGQLVFVFRLNAEALLAGISLDGLQDTDSSAQVETYTQYRDLSPEALVQEIEAASAQLIGPMAVSFDGVSAVLRFGGAEVEPAAAPDLPRSAFLTVTAPIPSRAQAFALLWPEGYGALVLRQNGVEEPFTGQLSGGETTQPIRLGGGYQRTGWQAFADYIPVGFDHILPKGLDHILFVLGLFFLSVKLGALLWQISAFTLAHTVTLALGALGWVSVPTSIVEPLIAASIAFVALENVMTSNLHRWRPAVVFCFGLLHGLGFASVLGEFGLPEAQFIPALLGFNIGVELGQLTVIATAFAAVGIWFGRKTWYRRAISIPASLVIAAIGTYWFVERAFLT